MGLQPIDQEEQAGGFQSIRLSREFVWIQRFLPYYLGRTSLNFERFSYCKSIIEMQRGGLYLANLRVKTSLINSSFME